MPAEKISHYGSNCKTAEHNSEAGVERANSVNENNSTTMTFHSNTDVNPGNSVSDFDNRIECPYCSGEKAESESGQRSCQHWTQVVRASFNTRQAQKKKLRGLQNGHPDASRYSNSRNVKESTNIQRSTVNSDSFDGLTIRNPIEVSTSNAASSRFKYDRSLHSGNKSVPISNTEPTKSIGSNSSSPVPSVSSDLPNGHDFSDNRTFPRYPHKSSRSFRSTTQASELDDVNQRSNASPVTIGGSNTRPRPSVHRSNVNTSPQSGTAPTAYQNGPCDQWRRPTNNGSWRRSHHTLPFAPRNPNQFHRYNGPGAHPGRPHQNFSRNRIPVSGIGDPSIQANDSPNSVPNGPSAQPDSCRESVKKPQTSWATVAVGVQCEQKLCTPENNSRNQLVNFLLDQWHRFDRKST
ncbi:hypothetical protein MN116_006642 [Schistosoma mekongi]|uniref:Uncharacterized protein n=1 Tax=Schistosoma mekongi TaxID=38744 RepID=A0AAE1Z9D2_SCHME|nr:hypothetical protein MN116_006642 [Schistosoma mekongi]